ncbi:MAG: hypothetical protein O3C59_14155 [Proteobacteria bacterium]|nr:hypothetical protein [Pseudomonadota bacterium]
MRTVILVYSRSGRSLAMARLLSAQCGAEIREIKCPRYEGPLGRLRVWGDIVAKRLPEISVAPDIGPADLLIVGAPVWAGQLAAPLRRALQQAERMPPVVGVFATRRRMGFSTLIDMDLEALALSGIAPTKPMPFLSLLRPEHQVERARKAIEVFCNTLAPLLERRVAPALTLSFRAA